MKKIIYILIFNLINISMYGQDCKDCEYKSDEIWISIESDKNFKKTKGLVTSTNDNKLDNVLTKYKAYSIEQVFPYSKIKELQQLYTIKFQGNIDELTSELKTSYDIKDIIKRPAEENISLYEPSDEFWNSTDDHLWHLKKIGAEDAWDITRGNLKVKIACIDTWFDINHPDLKNKIYPTYDPYSNTSYDSDCNRNHHGTIVTSFIASKTDGGGALASIGFNCMMICYQAWAGSYIQRAHHASLAMNADVLTSSAGGWTCTGNINYFEKLAVKEILDHGTIIVMPAGNGKGTHCEYDGRHHPYKPLSSDYDERVIIVSSTDKNDNHQFINNGVDATHSHYPEVDICAPGYNTTGAIQTSIFDEVENQCIESQYLYYPLCRGTSFATPIVAGVCALMKSVNPCLTPAQAKSIIKETADPIVDAGLFPGLVGAGRINANKAVKKAMEAGTKYIQNKSYSGTIVETAETELKAGYATTDALPYGNVVINSGSNVTFKATRDIEITPGFEIMHDAEFSMEIYESDCFK